MKAVFIPSSATSAMLGSASGRVVKWRAWEAKGFASRCGSCLPDGAHLRVGKGGKEPCDGIRLGEIGVLSQENVVPIPWSIMDRFLSRGSMIEFALGNDAVVYSCALQIAGGTICRGGVNHIEIDSIER